MTQDFFGIDIGSTTIKAVQLRPTGNGTFTLVANGIIETPPGAPISESEIDITALASAIKTLKKEAHITTNNVVSAFTEASIFTRVIELPVMSDKELDTAMKWESEQYIPLPINDVKIDWNILHRPEKKTGDQKMSVFLVAAPIPLIEKYIKILQESGLTPISMETEIVAISRSLIERGSQSTTLIISIGAQTTDLCIISRGTITFTRSIATGGNALVRSIAQELGFKESQAREYMKNYGLMEEQLEGKIVKIIKPIFNVIVNEIERAILYFQSRHPSEPIERSVLCGGIAKLPGLILYFVDALGMEIQVGSPWVNIVKPETKQKQEELERDAAFYSVATGLAMRSFEEEKVKK